MCTHKNCIQCCTTHNRHSVIALQSSYNKVHPQLYMYLATPNMLTIFPSHTSQNVTDYSFYSHIITDYTHIVFSSISSIGSWLRLPSECKVRSSSEYKSSFFEVIFIISDDLWGQWKSHSFVSRHSPFWLFLYHACECPIILILCLWASYYSGIMLAKTVTYNFQNYAGILRAGLVVVHMVLPCLICVLTCGHFNLCY